MTNSVLTSQDARRPTDLATLANEINDLTDRATEAARTAVEHARECGELLNQAKSQIGHGGFQEWLKDNCRLKPRQAQKYMRLAREWPAIEAKCAPSAHLTIAGALRLLDSGERLMQLESAEVEGGTTPTVQRDVAERRAPDPPVAGSGDPFDEEDPFGVGGGEEDGTDSGGQDAQELPPPDAKGDGTDDSGGLSRTPAEEFKIQKSKTVKTVEALMRAFDDLQRLRKSPRHQEAIDATENLLLMAREWPK